MSWYDGIKKGGDVVFLNRGFPQTVEVRAIELVGLKPNPMLSTTVVEPNIPDTTPAFLLDIRIGGYDEMNILTDGATFWSHTDPIHTKLLKGWARRTEVFGTVSLPNRAKQIMERDVKEFAEQIRAGEDQ